MQSSRKRLKLSEDGTSVAVPSMADNNNKTRLVKLTDSALEHKNSRTLFIRSLPLSTTTEQLADLFSQNALLKHAVAVLDRETKHCKGYGFATFADPEDAAAAKSTLDDTNFNGKRIRIEFAESRHRDLVSNANEDASSSLSVIQSLKKKARQAENVVHKSSLPKHISRLIVRNLPWSVREPQQLANMFVGYGKVKDAKLPKQQSGALRGFGFVLLRDLENAKKAIAEMNGKQIDGRTIAVDFAAPKNVWMQNQNETPHAHEKESLPESHELQPYRTYPESWNSDIKERLSSTNEYEVKENLTHGKTETTDSDTGTDENFEEEDKSATLFIRNLPFTTDDALLYEHFKQFGPLRYAKIVMDQDSSDESRSRGTGFINFYRPEDAKRCLEQAPATQKLSESLKSGQRGRRSVLQEALGDSDGRYIIQGRLLQISQCVRRRQALQLEAESRAKRDKEDIRHLFLLREGTISPASHIFDVMSSSDIQMREQSVKQRQDLVKKNPSLYISLTRIAVRNIPRFLSSKGLKALAREAVVGFATDVKAGRREPLSSEERSRDDPAIRERSRSHNEKGRGIVKQAKIIFENRDGSKVYEDKVAGRSRGYGFIEYTSHRCALMGLRWLNGYLVRRNESNATDRELPQTDTPKRLIAEFAIENTQVVQRRRDRESKAREAAQSAEAENAQSLSISHPKKEYVQYGQHETQQTTSPLNTAGEKNGHTFRKQIIRRKRAKRRLRKA